MTMKNIYLMKVNIFSKYLHCTIHRMCVIVLDLQLTFVSSNPFQLAHTLKKKTGQLTRHMHITRQTCTTKKQVCMSVYLLNLKQLRASLYQIYVVPYRTSRRIVVVVSNEIKILSTISHIMFIYIIKMVKGVFT